MLNKKLLGVVLGVLALVIIPTVSLAQEDDTVDIQIMMEDLEESMSDITEDVEDYDYDWEYEWDWDYDDTYDTMGYTGDVAESIAALGIISSVFSLIGLVIMLPIGLVIYVYTSVAYMTIAKKLNMENTWFAWIPILRCIQRFQIAGMSGWFTLLMFIPLVNTVLAIIALMKTCERRGLDKLLGLLGLIPIANYILMGVLAWKKDSTK